MSELLDLDALLPEPKKIKINGKIIECHPPTIRQLLAIQKAADASTGANVDPQEAVERLEEALSAIVPAIKEDKSIDFTLNQFYSLIKFLQEDAIPDAAKEAKSYPVQKKTDSPVE